MSIERFSGPCFPLLTITYSLKNLLSIVRKVENLPLEWKPGFTLREKAPPDWSPLSQLLAGGVDLRGRNSCRHYVLQSPTLPLLLLLLLLLLQASLHLHRPDCTPAPLPLLTCKLQPAPPHLHNLARCKVQPSCSPATNLTPAHQPEISL